MSARSEIAIDWERTDTRLPAERELVDTKIDDPKGIRNHQPLRRQGNLWFFEDWSMCVYYTPTHWRSL